MVPMQHIYPADTSVSQMPFIPPGEDALMPDIDWVSEWFCLQLVNVLILSQREWDKLFPPDQNTGNLDLSPDELNLLQGTNQ
jgi:hypothetical protein